MTKVEIHKTDLDGSQSILVTVFLNNHQVSFKGDQKLIDRISKDGIVDYSDHQQQVIFPEEGKKFLEQLKNNFDTIYLSATNLIETSETN